MRGKSLHAQNIIKLIEKNSSRQSTWQVFQDFVAISAISIRNAVDKTEFEKYEAEYLNIVKRYDRSEIDEFPRMLGELVLALEDNMTDILGVIFSKLGLGNKWKGQFFTPDHVCQLMAAISFSDQIEAQITDKGFITLSEPAVGGGAMVIASARHMKAQGVNYQQHLHVTAVDVDIRSVHMAYIQFSLLHIPATIIHGNTLLLEEWSHWQTPAHILGNWDWKLRLRSLNTQN